MKNLLLLHGAGGNPEDWDRFRAELPDVDCVVPDLTGLTTWEAMLDHLEGLDLDNPAVVGASLGGALAVRWAKRHPDCPGVVNLDGHGWPSTYPGLTESEVVEWRARLTKVYDAMAENMPPHHVALRPLIDNESVLELYDGLTVPAMAVLAMELLPAQEPFAKFYAAIRVGVVDDLFSLGTAQPTEVPAHHGMLATHPVDMAMLARHFLWED